MLGAPLRDVLFASSDVVHGGSELSPATESTTRAILSADSSQTAEEDKHGGQAPDGTLFAVIRGLRSQPAVKFG